MERRVFFAILLTFFTVMVWSSLQPRPEKKPGEEQAKQEGADNGPDSAARTQPNAAGEAGKGESGQTAPDTPPESPARHLQTSDAPVFEGELVLENETQRILFDQRGGTIETLWLLDYDETVGSGKEGTYEGKLRFIRRWEGAPAALSLRDDDASGDDIDPYWPNTVLWETDGPDGKGGIRFHLDFTREGMPLRFTRSYQLTDHGNRITVSLVLEARGEVNASAVPTFWLCNSAGVYPPDRAKISPIPARSILGQLDEDEIIPVVETSKDIEDEDDHEKRLPRIRYAADLGFYFQSVLSRVADGEDDQGRITTVEEEDGVLGTRTELRVRFDVDAANKTVKKDFDLYVGPKDHRWIKKNYEEGDLREIYLDLANSELMSQSFCPCTAGPMKIVVQVISKAVIWCLDFFGGLFGSMGVAIIVLTLLVRVMMFPVTRKSQTAMQLHSHKMAKVKPKLDALKEKYGKDRQKFASEQMKLMKKEGVSMVPLGGCLPMFLQIPIFFGLFSAIRFDVDLRHATFLWCQDLSMPDTVYHFARAFSPPCCMPIPPIKGINVFPLLMIAAMFFNQLAMPKSPDPNMRQQQKMMMFMPLLFGVMMYGYAAGLSLYWLSSSLFGIFEQRVIKKLFPIEIQEKKG